MIKRVAIIIGFFVAIISTCIIVSPSSLAAPRPPVPIPLPAPDRGTCSVETFAGFPYTVNNCKPQYLPKVNGTRCECGAVNDAVARVFELSNGIMIPISIIVGMFIIILSGYKILTSQGDPASLQTGKENLTSAIIGLIFVLISVSILRVIIQALITGGTTPF